MYVHIECYLAQSNNLIVYLQNQMTSMIKCLYRVLLFYCLRGFILKLLESDINRCSCVFSYLAQTNQTVRQDFWTTSRWEEEEKKHHCNGNFGCSGVYVNGTPSITRIPWTNDTNNEKSRTCVRTSWIAMDVATLKLCVVPIGSMWPLLIYIHFWQLTRTTILPQNRHWILNEKANCRDKAM